MLSAENAGALLSTQHFQLSTLLRRHVRRILRRRVDHRAERRYLAGAAGDADGGAHVVDVLQAEVGAEGDLAEVVRREVIGRPRRDARVGEDHRQLDVDRVAGRFDEADVRPESIGRFELQHLQRAAAERRGVGGSDGGDELAVRSLACTLIGVRAAGDDEAR